MRRRLGMNQGFEKVKLLQNAARNQGRVEMMTFSCTIIIGWWPCAGKVAKTLKIFEEHIYTVSMSTAFNQKDSKRFNKNIEKHMYKSMRILHGFAMLQFCILEFAKCSICECASTLLGEFVATNTSKYNQNHMSIYNTKALFQVSSPDFAAKFKVRFVAVLLWKMPQRLKFFSVMTGAFQERLVEWEVRGSKADADFMDRFQPQGPSHC